MKKWITFALIASCFGGQLYAQNDVADLPDVEPTIVDMTPTFNEVYVEEPPRCFTEFPFIEELDISAVLSELEDARILSEVNDVKGTDAYPHLSKDGLRLYWTQSGEGDHLVFASREHIDQEFGEAQNLPTTFANKHIMSCWLSANELTLYYVSTEKSRKLMKATRNHLGAVFGQPEEIQLHLKEGESLGFFTAPSLTQDESQLFIYVSADRQKILEFKRQGKNEFVELGELQLEDGAEAEPGQLSHDGLSFSLTAKGQTNFITFHRSSLEEKFETMEQIDLGGDFHQITHNNEVMVLGYSPDDSWETNELYTCKHPMAEFFVEDASTLAKENTELESQHNNSITSPQLQVVTLEVFPNPTSAVANIRFELPETIEQLQLDVMDVTGKLIRTEQIRQRGEQTLELNVADFTAGTYFCRLSGAGVQTISKALVIQ